MSGTVAVLLVVVLAVQALTLGVLLVVAGYCHRTGDAVVALGRVLLQAAASDPVVDQAARGVLRL